MTHPRDGEVLTIHVSQARETLGHPCDYSSCLSVVTKKLGGAGIWPLEKSIASSSFLCFIFDGKNSPKRVLSSIRTKDGFGNEASRPALDMLISGIFSVGRRAMAAQGSPKAQK